MTILGQPFDDQQPANEPSWSTGFAVSVKHGKAISELNAKSCEWLFDSLCNELPPGKSQLQNVFSNNNS